MNKNKIKEALREGTVKNVSGVAITRPNQELIVMRGIPGSGKSTKANKMIGEGVIHSTDTLIEATGDYNGHFAKMVESKDWSAHSRMHSNNFKNAKKSMEEGISPVIVDNTNIKANESKKYVEAALKMGFSENNIKFVDVGDGGCTAEVLAERNTHGVPLETIEKMMASHKGVGPLTVKKVMESKDMYGTPKFSYVKLDDTSKAKLLTAFGHLIPKGWLVHAHHMTIKFGKPLDDTQKEDIGKTIQLRGVSIGKSDMAVAIEVDGYDTNNKIAHITLGVSPEGKPVMSNNITDWKKLDSYINLSGEVKTGPTFMTPTSVKL